MDLLSVQKIRNIKFVLAKMAIVVANITAVVVPLVAPRRLVLHSMLPAPASAGVEEILQGVKTWP